MPRKFNLGNFIQVSHIAKSIELLTYQLKQTSPLYNNLDFSLYRNCGLDKIDPELFYNDFIRRDSLYYFEALFFSEKYYSIQRAYKIREYHFLSLNALIIYYAIGFYILELLEKRLAIQQELYSKKNIHIYYGGKLNYQNPTDSKIFYYEDYKDFLLHKEQLTKPENAKNVFALSLDIKSFFYTVNHKILLDTIDKTATVSVKKALNYNDDTKEALLIILNYLQHNQLGLPVANQNIISSFLSSVGISVIVDTGFRSKVCSRVLFPESGNLQLN